MTVARAGAAVVKHQDFLFAIGGVDGKVFLNSVERARLNSDGSLGSWELVNHMPEARGFISAVIKNDRLYVIGGGNGPFGKNLLRTVLSAPISEDGDIGSWRTEKHAMLTPRRCAKTFIHDNQLFAVGGFGGALLDTVEVANINSSGELGEWRLRHKTLLIPRYVNELKEAKGYVFALGGHHANSGRGISSVEYMSLAKQGEWMETTPLIKGRYAFASAVVNENIFVLGGLSGTEYLQEVELNNISGLLNKKSWKNTTTLPHKMANFSAVEVGDKIYVLGGSTRQQYLRKVWYAEVNQSGDIGYWGQVSDLQRAKRASANQQVAQLPNHGKILKTINTVDYSYLLVETAEGEKWLAGPKNDYTINNVVSFSEGVYMSNFYSKALNKNFDAILFVGTIELEK